MRTSEKPRSFLATLILILGLSFAFLPMVACESTDGVGEEIGESVDDAAEEVGDAVEEDR